MSKIAFYIIGFIAFVGIIINAVEGDSMGENFCWIILVLCIGFCAIIERMDKRNE